MKRKVSRLAAVALCLAVGGVASILAWYAVPRASAVAAHLRVSRVAERVLRETAPPDPQEFTVFRNTQKELLRGPQVISRALGDPAIAELPLVKDQPDPVIWLESQLQVDYPGDAEVLRVRMHGADAAQLAQIVDAVVDTYFREVVERDALVRRARRDALQQKYNEANEKLLVRMKQIESLAKTLGVQDHGSLELRNRLLADELGRLRVDLSNSMSKTAETRLEIMGLEQEIELAKDPGAVAAKIDAKINEDKKIIELEERLANFGAYVAQVESLTDDKEKPTLQRVRKEKADLQERLDTRKAELQEKFASLTSADRVKELEAKLRLAKERLTTLEAHITEKQKEFEEQSRAIKNLSGNSAELENQKSQLQTGSAVRDQLGQELAWREIEADAPPRVQRIDQARPTVDTSSQRKLAASALAGVAGFLLSGLAVVVYGRHAQVDRPDPRVA